MNYNSLNSEDKEWLSRIEDLSLNASTKNVLKFTKFCDEKLIYIAKYSKLSVFSNSLVWGGYEEFERGIIGFFPDYQEPDSSLFPISLLKITGAFGCNHRDFLGSLLGLGINRDMIGDILVCDDCCFVFVHSTICDYITFNLTKVANKHVSVCCEEDISRLPERKFEEICGTVSSERLDCFVSLFTHKSRSDTQKLITSEKVFVNHHVCTNASLKLSEGDVVSVRKYGKARLFKIGGETKKGRIRLIFYKYVFSFEMELELELYFKMN